MTKNKQVIIFSVTEPKTVRVINAYERINPYTHFRCDIRTMGCRRDSILLFYHNIPKQIIKPIAFSPRTLETLKSFSGTTMFSPRTSVMIITKLGRLLNTKIYIKTLLFSVDL